MLYTRSIVVGCHIRKGLVRPSLIEKDPYGFRHRLLTVINGVPTYLYICEAVSS